VDGGTFVGLHTHSHGATWVHHLDLDGVITSMRLYTSAMDLDSAITSMRLYTSVMDLDGANFNEAVHLCNGTRFHL
jgi:hypothetical protein